MEFRVLIHLRDAQMFLLLQHILATDGFSASSVANLEEIGNELANGDVKAVMTDCAAAETSPSMLHMLKLAHPEIVIILLREQHDRELHDPMADFVLIPPFAPVRLIELFRRLRLDALMKSGGAKDDTNVLRFADLEMNTVAARVRRNGKEVVLTALQFRLLRFLLSDPEIVRSREELIAAAWPAAVDVEP